MTDKSTRENRTCLALELARLCPKVPLHEIAADVETLGRIGARVRLHEERMCSYADYYERHQPKDDDGTDPLIDRAEKRAQAIASKYGMTVEAGGDCRGYAFHLRREGLRGNTWGGDEHGFGLN